MGKPGCCRIHLNGSDGLQIRWRPGQGDRHARRRPQRLQQIQRSDSCARDEVGPNFQRPLSETLVDVVVCLPPEEGMGAGTHDFSCLMSSEGLLQR